MFLYVVLLSFEVQRCLTVVENSSILLPCRNVLLCGHERVVLTMYQVNARLLKEIYKVDGTIFERALAEHEFHYV